MTRPPDVSEGLSYADGGTTSDPPGWTVGDVLRAAADVSPDATAIVVRDGGRRQVWTFESLLHDAAAIARWLIDGDRISSPIALWAPNSADVVLAQLAIALAGATLVPLNPALRPDELAHALSVSGAAQILVADDHRGESLAAVVEAVAPDVERIVLDGTGAALLAGAGSARADTTLPDVGPDQLAQLQFTSGTTGPSKAVRITHAAMALTGRVFADRLGLEPTTPLLNPMPLFHTAGNVLGVMGTLTARAPHIVLQFSPDDTLTAIADERPSIVSLAPTLIHMVQSHERFTAVDLSSVDVVFTGGATMSEAVVREVERGFGARLAITFGMTETSGTALMTGPNDPDDARRTTVGRAMAHTEVKIVDPDSRTVPIGTPGELCVRGPRVTTGYLGDPDATAAVLDVSGWLRTGDEATMDAEGRVRITGRLKDMIKTGGENVAPAEVEAVVASHDSVDMAAVVGVPDERWGELVVAFVTPASGASIDPAVLDAFCRERLAGFKVPRRWHAVDDLPRTASGKVQRAKLRAAATSSRAGDH